MYKQIHYLALFALAFIILSCLFTLMIVFTGGSLTGADVRGLLLTQLLSIPLSLGVLAVEVRAFVRLNGWRIGLALLWQKIPAWLVLAFVLLNSLVLIGELSVVLLDYLMQKSSALTDHVPLLALLSASSAFAVLYGKTAQRYGSGIKTLGRWP
ncbi:MAG: hypothetical protein AAGA61_02295 [Pseudomonadota bacterium]